MRASTIKAITTAAFAVTAVIPAASAADLAARPYTKAPVMVDPGYNWSGFYIGGNVGYSWGRERTDGNLTGTQNVSVFRTAGPTLISSVTTAAALPLSGRGNMDGFIGGGQIGYNWQSSKWLFGLEADFQGSDERATADVCTVAGCPLGSSILTANYKLDWFGTARGRGWLPCDRSRAALCDRRSRLRSFLGECSPGASQLGVDARGLDSGRRSRGCDRSQLVRQA